MQQAIPVPAAFVSGIVIFLVVVWDAFESIILPRRVTRKFRLTRLFYRVTWGIATFVANLFSARKTRETLLGFFGPSSLLLLLAVWAIGLVLGFGLMQYGAGSAVVVTGGQPSFSNDFYLSGTTFFTLGLGDVVPRSQLARGLVVAEAGFGFGFLAAIIGYLPFIYGSFSSREIEITLLDSRAGTPPTAGELLRRHSYPGGREALRAVHDAMPLLERAKKVTLFAFSSRPSALRKSAEMLVDHLAAHGVKAEHVSDWTNTGDLTAVEALFASLDTQDADLIVAGAFGHSRIYEGLFGGVTLDLMHQQSLPVLMSH